TAIWMHALLTTIRPAATVGSPIEGVVIPFGGHTFDDAYVIAKMAKNAAKNIASEATNSTIPSTGLLLPRTARSSWARSAALTSTLPRRAPARPAARRTRAG